MARRLKLLSGLSSIAATGALAISGCGDKAEEKAAEPAPIAPPSAHHPNPVSSAATGGEAESGAVADAATDKAAFLSALQLVRGHLKAGVTLYEAGDRATGVQHLRHPQAEILTSLAPAFAAHGADSVEPAIDALADAGEAGAAPAELSRLEGDALAAVAAAGAKAQPSLKDRLIAVARTLTVAGDEYAIGVKDGAVVNLHEYHDAFGFIATAIIDLDGLKGADVLEEQAIATALDQARIAATAAPDVVPPKDELKPAAVIYGAAARVEIAARGL